MIYLEQSSEFAKHDEVYVYYKWFENPPEGMLYATQFEQNLPIDITDCLGMMNHLEVVRFSQIVPHQSSLEQVQFLWNVFTAESE